MFVISFPISHAHRRYISYTTIGYKYSFVHEKSKEVDLYIVDNVENGIILSPEGPNFEGRPREHHYCLTYFFGQGQSLLQVFETPITLNMVESVKYQFCQPYLSRFRGPYPYKGL